MGRRLLRQLLVALPAAASMAFSGVAYASTATDATSTHTIKVGTVTRSWEQIDPPSAATDSTPIVVVLSGINATTSQEISRDGLVPYVSDGKAELIYPVAVGKSWNADGCCGLAAADDVNDVAFLQALIARVDRGHRRPVYLVGYSNGGRLAYRMACTDPAFFDATAVVKAMPEPGCVVSGPLTILQVDSTNDYAVPYQPGDVGKEQPAATVEVARLRAVDGCTSAAADVTHGSLTLQTWSHCSDGSMVAFATYQGGAHQWPEGTATTPSAASVIWNFFSVSKTAASQRARSGVWCSADVRDFLAWRSSAV